MSYLHLFAHVRLCNAQSIKTIPLIKPQKLKLILTFSHTCLQKMALYQVT